MLNEKFSLKEIIHKHSGKITDKWSIYLDIYEKEFELYRNKSISLLEIGVQNGGSLEIWSNYFHNANVLVGCDINEKCGKLKFEDHRIKVIVCDIKEEACLNKILDVSESFDIVIDDGSHTSEDIIKAFVRLFPYVTNGGIYVIEDLHTNYWRNFTGGVFNPKTAINFLKRLVDIINYEAWGKIGKFRKEVLLPYENLYNISIDESMLSHIHSIKFLNSMCIIKKENPNRNTLGNRVISGNYEEVAVSHKELNGTFLKDIFSSADVVFDKENDPISLSSKLSSLEDELVSKNNEISNLQSKLSSLENELVSKNNEISNLQSKLSSLENELVSKNNEISNLQSKLSSLENELVSVLLSKSWRYTRPLRKFMNKLRSFKKT